MNKVIAVTIGDIKGIGIELLIKIWKNKRINNFILFTNLKLFKNYQIKKNLNLPLNVIDKKSKKLIKLNKNNFNIFDFEAKNNDENTYKSLEESYYFVKKFGLSGIITLPLNKKKIIKNINNKFIGQTEYYQKLDNQINSNMIFYHPKIITTTLTHHVSLKIALTKLKDIEILFQKIVNLNNTLKTKFKIKIPKFALAGINPHAGEQGEIGDEEIKYLLPLLKKLKKNKININGPISGDAMITNINLKKYDCFIFNYHDQSLIPFKIISNFSGINYTDNLSILRVSPDHGTAYDIVDQNMASDLSLINCFKLINKIFNN